MPAPPDRNAPYATQFEPLMDYLHRMVCSDARTIALPIQPDAFAEGRLDDIQPWVLRHCASWCKWSSDNCVIPSKRPHCADCAMCENQTARN